MDISHGFLRPLPGVISEFFKHMTPCIPTSLCTHADWWDPHGNPGVPHCQGQHRGQGLSVPLHRRHHIGSGRCLVCFFLCQFSCLSHRSLFYSIEGVCQLTNFQDSFRKFSWGKGIFTCQSSTKMTGCFKSVEWVYETMTKPFISTSLFWTIFCDS